MNSYTVVFSGCVSWGTFCSGNIIVKKYVVSRNQWQELSLYGRSANFDYKNFVRWAQKPLKTFWCLRHKINKKNGASTVVLFIFTVLRGMKFSQSLWKNGTQKIFRWKGRCKYRETFSGSCYHYCCIYCVFCGLLVEDLLHMCSLLASFFEMLQ